MKQKIKLSVSNQLLIAFFLLVSNAVAAQTWRPLSTGLTSTDYQGIYFLNSNKGWAVGAGGKVITTNDGGSTWTAQTTSTSSYLLGVNFADANNGWAIGTGGGIIATTDGGNNWVNQTSGVSGELDDVCFVSATKGWIAGGPGVLYTSNGGTTWTSQYATRTMRSVSFVDANNGWAVGIFGTIIRTTNGGSTWTTQTSGTTESLWGVKFISTTKGWAVGTNGTILTTSNGGTTWTAQSAGTTNFITSIYFLDANNGWAVSYYGAIYNTTDGGSTWATQLTGYSSGFFRGSFLSPSQAFVAGSNNTILKYCTTAVITSEPTDVNICLNANTSFSVSSTGNNLTYLWQIKASGSNTWNTASGGAFVGSSYTTSTLELNSVYAAYDNASIRCIVKGDCTGDTSRAATITINKTKVNTQPNPASLCLNGNTSFSVVASGISLTYLWQIKASGSNTWYDASGGAFVGTSYTTNTLQMNSVYSAYNTASIRCIVSGACSNDTSVSATITIKDPSSSTTNTTVCPSSLPYIWNGLTFNAAGSQTAHLTNAAGCDSAATLNLSIGNNVMSTSNVFACGSYSWNGVTYNSTGVYNKVFTSAAGCDSTATLNLTLLTTLPTISGVNAVCVGNSVMLNSTIIGGVWASLNNKANINATTSVLTGANAGTGLIKYSYNLNGCSLSTTANVTVNPNPAAPTINYALGTTNPQNGAPSGSYCVGRVFTVVGTPTGGAWTSTGIASITNGGAVTINAVGAGSIKYTYTNSNGCSSSRTIAGSGYSCAARGISTFDDQLSTASTVNDFTMYPNPAKGKINLNVETLVGAGSIVITDLYGKAVKTQNLSMGTNTIDIANLSKGMYFVSTITNEGKTTKKLVVE